MLPVMVTVVVVVDGLGGLVIVGHRHAQGIYQVHCNRLVEALRIDAPTLS
jgi:hypothetical protein